MNKYFEDDDFPETKKELKTARKIASKRDRSKYKKTDSAKREKHEQKQTEKKLSQKTLLRGRVLVIFPEEVLVEHEKEIYQCTLRGILKKASTRLKNLVAVGDFVHFEVEKAKEGSIAHVEQRKTILSRNEHLHQKTRQIIATNIDQVLITVSVVNPPLKPSLVDRYIIATCKGGMEPVIVVNKIDLLEDEREEKELFDLFLQTYKDLKIPIIALSAQTGEGMDALQMQMKDKASVFSGQSGVGKSSLINAMTGLSLLVGEVIEKTRKGAHTTSSAHLIPLPFGGWCIDTPGIRSFGVWDLQKEDLSKYFPEIEEMGRECKYPDCSHTHEPGCVLRKAVDEDKISPLRFASYLRLLADIA